MSEPGEVTVYIETDGDADAVAEQLRVAVAALPNVDAVEVDVEDVERSAAEVIQSVTLTLTAAGGVVGAANFLLTDLAKLIKNVKGIRAAWRDTEDGPVPIDVTDASTPDSGTR